MTPSTPTRRRCFVGALLCLFGCVHAPQGPSPQVRSHATARYTVTIFDNFEGAKVRICIEGAPVRELVPIGDSAGRELSGAWSQGDALETARGRIRLREPGRASCVDYETRFRDPMFRASDSTAILVSQTQWLWRPEPFPPDLEASVRFVLPADGKVSLPWRHSGATYFPEASAFFASAFGAFGRFDHQTFSVAGVGVEVTRLGPRPTDDDIRHWLDRAIRTTASVGERFPREQVHFMVVPVRGPPDEVLFGMVRRGGGTSVLLVPSPDASVAELEGNWVAVHELSHLWLPPLRAKDRWVSEGIATYLQEVLRARCRLQSSERAWSRLLDGFERGRRSGTGRTLTGESLSMNRTGTYHRVYWAGTAFALELDVRLREASNGEMTLLRAISDAQHTWGSGAQPVAASVFLGALQEASGATFIEALAQTYAGATDFPDTAYAASPKYRDVRAQITEHADQACGISAESSR
jgi:hypothetical protein